MADNPVNVSIRLALPSMTGIRQRPDISQAENSAAVSHNSYEMPDGRIATGEGWIVLN